MEKFGVGSFVKMKSVAVSRSSSKNDLSVPSEKPNYRNFSGRTDLYDDKEYKIWTSAAPSKCCEISEWKFHNKSNKITYKKSDEINEQQRSKTNSARIDKSAVRGRIEEEQQSTQNEDDFCLWVSIKYIRIFRKQKKIARKQKSEKERKIQN